MCIRVYTCELPRHCWLDHTWRRTLVFQFVDTAGHLMLSWPSLVHPTPAAPKHTHTRKRTSIQAYKHTHTRKRIHAHKHTNTQSLSIVLFPSLTNHFLSLWLFFSARKYHYYFRDLLSGIICLTVFSFCLCLSASRFQSFFFTLHFILPIPSVSSSPFLKFFTSSHLDIHLILTF